ncbi:MAG: cell division protein ZipA [Pseudomonadota bacterium]
MPELTLRDWMVVVGSLLILAVIVDAFLRMRTQQRERVRMKLAATPADDQPVDDIASFRELPNGGARVVTRSAQKAAENGDDEALSARGDKSAARVKHRESSVSSSVTSRTNASDATAAGDNHAPAAPAFNDDRKSPQSEVPLETEVHDDSSDGEEIASRADDVSTSSVSDPGDQKGQIDQIDQIESELSSEATSEEVTEESPETDLDDPVHDEAEVLAGVSALDEPANLDWLEDMPRAAVEEEEAGALPRNDDSEVIVLHVLARDDAGFSGASILEILLACDLRFGDMSFFHRHEQEAGRGPIQFSVANMLKPGVFDIDNMDSLSTRGLVFFLTLPGPEDMIRAFDYMLETARVVAKNLGGDVLDESRSVLTQQAVEHSKQQIRELERRLLAHQRA